MISAFEWKRRFEQQARWTSEVRSYLFKLSGLKVAERVLETGCGAGAVLAALPDYFSGQSVGIDISFEYLSLAQQSLSAVNLACANVYNLPYRSNSFDLVFCHYFLLWVDPVTALREMRRVTIPGGTILALAEPDYGGRIDYPVELAWLGKKQSQALASQGADPETGRKLAALFRQAGLINVFSGVTGGYWDRPPAESDRQLEWAILRHDLGEDIPEDQLRSHELIDQKAWDSGERILYIPTFYASGKVPE